MIKKKQILFLSVVGAIAVIIITFFHLQKTAAFPTYTYQIIKTYPHDPQAFTQGLIYSQDSLYEGTGLRGNSSIRRVDLETGNVVQIHHLNPNYFGEGITLWQDKLIQLTWQAKKGFVYNYQTFEELQQFSYDTEGWGLTHDEQHLIMSDGSDTLYFLDPQTFKEVKRLKVVANGQSVPNLNELEYIQGEIWANIWFSNCIARISSTTGQVLTWVDLTDLLDSNLIFDSNAVLNGIAYDQTNERIFLTGKLWPNLFEVKIIPSSKQKTCSIPTKQ